MTTERLIKKYANRRLYDASQSRHVTLDDVREFIVKGEKIRVVEDKTGEDITRLILLQVIAEQEQFGKPILSTPLLESIVRFYGNGMQEFMGRYLEKSVETFMRQQEGVQAQMSKLMANAPVNAMTEFARQNLELWTQMQQTMAKAWMPGAAARGGESRGEASAPDDRTTDDRAAGAQAAGDHAGGACPADAPSADATPSGDAPRTRKPTGTDA